MPGTARSSIVGSREGHIYRGLGCLPVPEPTAPVPSLLYERGFPPDPGMGVPSRRLTCLKAPSPVGCRSACTYEPRSSSSSFTGTPARTQADIVPLADLLRQQGFLNNSAPTINTALSTPTGNGPGQAPSHTAKLPASRRAAPNINTRQAEVTRGNPEIDHRHESLLWTLCKHVPRPHCDEGYYWEKESNL